MRTAMTLGLMLLIAAPVVAARRSVDCQGGGEFLSIQDAVNASSTGDTIVVAPCVYNEQVLIPNGVRLTIQGSGADVTEIVWSGSLWSDATIRFGSSDLTVRSMKIRHEPETGYAILWDDRGLSLDSCIVRGCSGGGMYYGVVEVTDCDIWPSLGVGGGCRTSVVRNSHIGHFGFGGVALQAGHSLDSSNSYYGSLSFGDLAFAQCVGDSIGSTLLWGGPDSYDGLVAENCRIDHLEGGAGPEVALHGCSLGGISYDYYWGYGPGPPLDVLNCVITGSLDVQEIGKVVREGCASSADPSRYLLRVEHSTLLGDLSVECQTAAESYIRSNIVLGVARISVGQAAMIASNDFVGGADISIVSGSQTGNFEDDPRFCDLVGGNLALQDCSPCIGQAHDGGDVGAFHVGCDCDVPVESRSWGAIKALFRRQPSN